MHRYHPIDRSYFETAPTRFDNRIEVGHPLEVVWQIFESNAAWQGFTPAIVSAKWTSPPPLRAGSTRQVELSKWMGSPVIDEVFFLWTPTEHFAFYMEKGTTDAVHTYGELWSFTDLGAGNTEIRLRTAFSLNGWFFRGLVWLSSPLFRHGFQSHLETVKEYLNKHYPA